MPNQLYIALLMPPGTRVLAADSIQHTSQSVCKLLRVDLIHPNLMPVEEEEWKSLLDATEMELLHE